MVKELRGEWDIYARVDNSKCDSELSFLFAIHNHNEIHISIKFHENIPIEC